MLVCGYYCACARKWGPGRIGRTPLTDMRGSWPTVRSLQSSIPYLTFATLVSCLCDLVWCPFPAKSMSLPCTCVFFFLFVACAVSPRLPFWLFCCFLLYCCNICLSVALSLRLPATLVFRICTPSVRFYYLPLFFRV